MILIFFTFSVVCQINNESSNDTLKGKFPYKNFIVPSALIITGIVGLESHTLKDLSTQVQNEVNEHIDDQVTIDDFSQYAPMASVYVLNATGIEGKHRFKERTILLASSYLLTASTVLLTKKGSNVLRPDGSSQNSFPSGHTATAFVGAEFLWQEYRDVSVWYGIAGYVVATGTGLFRVYNDRHWLNDVIMGAGVGMLCTKFAYWIHPFVTQKLLPKNERNTQTAIVPFYNGEQAGLGMVLQF